MNIEEFKAKAFEQEGVKEEYDALEEEFALLKSMLLARREAGLTQAEVAARMGTKNSAVSRLESDLASGNRSPSLATLRKYAMAVGGKLEVRVVRSKNAQAPKHAAIRKSKTAPQVRENTQTR